MLAMPGGNPALLTPETASVLRIDMATCYVAGTFHTSRGQEMMLRDPHFTGGDTKVQKG